MWHRKLTLAPSPKVEGGARVAHMAPIMRYVASHARALEAAKAREIRKIRAQSDWKVKFTGLTQNSQVDPAV